MQGREEGEGLDMGKGVAREEKTENRANRWRNGGGKGEVA